MEDLSDLSPGVHRHGPITLSPVPEFGSGSDTEDPPTLPSLDLFRRRRAPSVSPDHEPGFLNLGLGLGFSGQEDQDWVRHQQHEQEHEESMGLGLGFPVQEDQYWARQQEQERGEAFEDWGGDEFFIGLRSAGRGNEFSRAHIPGFYSDSESESDTNEQIVTIGSDPDPGPPLFLNCLRIHDPSPASAEEFEWEEIDGSTDVISTVIREDDFQEDISFEMGGIPEEEATDVARTGIEWEVLHRLETYYMDDGFEDDFDYTSGFDDLLFGQFQELKGGRPAAKSVVESLPTVVLKKEEVNCAVCKDEILAEEKAKKLPCCHYYHEECILRWLGMRSTCPLCRYELPTDDAEYEKRKARRVGSNSGEGQV